MSYFEESDGCKIHLMEDGVPKVKILFLKKQGKDQRLVVNKNVLLNGKPLTVEVWIRNKHGVWNGTPNTIRLHSPFLQAGRAYPFTCSFWIPPTASEDKVPQELSVN